MITPATYNLSIPQNATFSKTFQLKDSTGTPLNLTGYNVTAQIWTSDKNDKLADFSVTWVDRTIGKFTLSLPATTTDAIGQSGVWDMLVSSSDGTKDYWLRGRAILEVGYTE